MVATNPMITPTIGRLSWGKIRNEVAKTVGIIAPPMKPCSARKNTISPRELERAQAKLMRVKPAQAQENSTRVDNSRERNPENGIMITSAIR